LTLSTPADLDRFHELQRRALLADVRLTADREGQLHLRAGDHHQTVPDLETAERLIHAVASRQVGDLAETNAVTP